MEDKQFMVQFSSVIGVLAVIAVACIILAIIFGRSETDPNDPVAQKVIEERIKPVGEVYVGSVPPEALAQSQAQAEKQTAQAAGAPKFSSGKEVYEAVCQVCHTTGAAGAPKLGDKAAWTKYLDKGIEGNYQAAINGAGAMPAKGGRGDISDEDVKSAVDYIVNGLN